MELDSLLVSRLRFALTIIAAVLLMPIQVLIGDR
jgi:hypothetical protein